MNDTQDKNLNTIAEELVEEQKPEDVTSDDNPNAKWYIVHTASGHESRISQALKQRIESEHLEHKILDVLVPTQNRDPGWKKRNSQRKDLSRIYLGEDDFR